MLFAVGVGTVLTAAPFWQKKDFSQWTLKDAKRILSDSPWAKTVTLNLSKLATQTRGAGDLTASAMRQLPSPPGIFASTAANPKAYFGSPFLAESATAQSGGATGQRGGPGQIGGQQPSSTDAPSPLGRHPGDIPQEEAPHHPGSQGTTVVIQWESATPVRLAEAKLKAGDGQPSPADVEQAKRPADYYLIALVGIPGKLEEGEDKEMATAATITPKDKQAIQAISVKERALPSGTRVLIFSFPKTQPITDDDRTVQFKLAKGPLPTEIKQDFRPKDMHYEGKLAL
jgi:hypothetical protein